MDENQSFLEMQVDQPIAANLNEVSRWAKFFGLLVIIGTGLCFLLFFFFWTRFLGAFTAIDSADTTNLEAVRIVFIITFAIVAVIIGILVSFLIKGANRIRTGIRNKDQLLFNSGLANLKNYFAMYGVLVIIAMFFELLGLVTN